MSSGFLDHPGRPGALGAILDETARAAEDFCRVVEVAGCPSSTSTNSTRSNWPARPMCDRGWGPTCDPEMILEHGIVHLLRHRRQIERRRRGI